VAGLRIDPVGAFNFYLTLIDSSNVAATLVTAAANFALAGFSECSGLEATLELFDFKEGGVNDYVHKFPTRASFANITLKRGVSLLPDDLWKWHYDFVQGKGKRKDGLIVLLSEARLPVKIWKFTRGIPMKWVGPSLNASQNNLAIESLEISHEGLSMELGALPSV
jgi:phage tail-like protein